MGRLKSNKLYVVRVTCEYVNHMAQFGTAMEGGSSLTQVRTQLYRDGRRRSR